MVNFTSHTADTYAASPFMSFAGVEGTGSTPTSQKHQAWDWDSVNSFPFYTPALLDGPPPPLYSTVPFPIYVPPPPPPPPSMVVPEYARSECFFKLEDGLAAGFGPQGSARIGLNLGHRTYFSSYDQMLLFGRSAHHQPPRCQAEGCMADLSGAKHYHRRHKVCDFHSKAAVVFFPGGVQQRFCQQCSRFHGLADFDDSKRSCRKRLAEHNRRRRKPQPQPTTKAVSPSPLPINTKPKEERKLSSSVQSNNRTHVQCCSNAGLDEQQKTVVRSQNTSGSALSLGGARGSNPKDSTFVYIEDKASQYQQQQQQQFRSQFTSPSSSSGAFFHHENPYNEGSRSTGGGSEAAQQHQSSILQLGQAMFEWDFI